MHGPSESLHIYVNAMLLAYEFSNVYDADRLFFFSLLESASRKDGDWTCPNCGNLNFSFRTVCNQGRCGARTGNRR